MNEVEATAKLTAVGVCLCVWDLDDETGKDVVVESNDECPLHILLAENARLRGALEYIRDHGKTHDKPCWALHQGDCAEVMQETARAVLELREAAT